MAYYLTKFGDIIFPLVQPLTEMPTAPGQPGVVQTVGGGFDAWGDNTAPPTFPVAVQYQVVATGANAAAYMTTVNALRGLGNTGAYLYRAAQDGHVQRAWARCRSVGGADNGANLAVGEVTCDFDVWEEWGDDWALDWHFDAGYFFDSGLYFDADPVTTIALSGSPKTFTVTNEGNVAVENCVLQLTAGDANLTAFTLACAAQDVKWTWTGTLVAGNELMIDCGARTVYNNGAGAYAGLVLAAEHLLVPWLRLAPGANSIVATWTGGGAGGTMFFDFADRWA